MGYARSVGSRAVGAGNKHHQMIGVDAPGSQEGEPEVALFKEQTMRQAARSATALGLILGTVSVSASAYADFPGERWDVPYVQINGAGAEQGALTVGLNNANQTYFYGSKPTKMTVMVRGPGKVDLKIIDQSTGTVIAERRGLAYSGSGPAATQSITAAALNWMDSLTCVGDCAVASSGSVPAIQTAQAPTPQPEAEKSEPAETVVARVEPKSDPKPKAQPKPEAQPKPTNQTRAAEPKPVKPKAPKPEPSLAAAALPKTTVAERAPSVKAPAPAAPATTADRPSGSLVTAALPKVDPQEKSPDVASPNLVEPAEPSRTTPKPTGNSGDTAPKVQQGQDADQVLAALDKQQQTTRPVQNVQPSVALPLPRPENLVSPLVESLGATPKPLEDVDAGTSVALASPNTSSEAPTTRGSLNQDAPVATDGGDDSDVKVPSAVTEPARATQPEAVAPAEPNESPTTGLTEDDDALLQSPTPVARTTEVEAPAAPTADVAAASPSVNPTSEDEPAAPSVPEEPDRPTAATPEDQPEAETEQTAAIDEPAEPNVNTEAPTATVEDSLQADAGEDTQVALVNPVQPVSRPTAAQPESTPEENQPEAAPAEDDPVEPVEADDGDGQQVASVDPNASGPTLANARWVGFTPAAYTGSDNKAGAWIAGPFDRKQRQGWITDTATGATTRVTFIWREAGAGSRTATLSSEAARALGLGQGDVANVAVYLPR